jgi:hypothetical protein
MTSLSGISDEELNCAFRTAITGTGDDESAQCLLLAQMLSVSPAECTVTRPMCLACQAHLNDRVFSNHPVFPSMAYQLALDHQESAASDAEQERWVVWSRRAEAALLEQLRTPVSQTGIPSCDLILPISQETPQLDDVIDSVLRQMGAVPILHLVCSTGSPTAEKYAGRWNIQIHQFDRELTWKQTFATLSPHLRTETVAVQDPHHPANTGRLAQALRELRDQGAELYVERSGSAARDCVSIYPDSLVVRRATLVDMDELPVDGTIGTIVELAIRQGRVVAWGQNLVAAESTRKEVVAVSQPAWLPPRTMPVFRKVRCDVVLPFHGQLDYVEQALQGLLDQEQAHAIVHLVDDATPGDISEFLNEWAAHPQVRVYHNRENIGQFQSFNNVARYWETDLVAVQDADDISLPHRLAWSAEMLDRTGADYFGAAVETFGDENVILPVMFESENLQVIPRDEIRRSFYPQWEKSNYFLENPTAMFRTAMFRELGGYADFGNRLMNRTSLDTEFQLRCLYRGVRFAISHKIVTLYRVHPQSATQDRQTGWGTSARSESIRQLEDRCQIFRQGDFDPRSFGAIGRYTGLTERWSGRT